MDIETSFKQEITIIGVYREDGAFHQLIKPDITGETMLQTLTQVTTIYTYNGSSFDLPVIHRQLGVDLKQLYAQIDLKFNCWRHNLYGGLKKVEIRLGIERGEVAGLNGEDAMVLWEKYHRSRQRKYLDTLLEYNKKDVLNLVILEEKLLHLDKQVGELCPPK